MRIRKPWNRKTSLKKYFCVFDVVTMQKVMLVSNLITNWVCSHGIITVLYAHWTI